MREDIERLRPQGLKAVGTVVPAETVAKILQSMVADDEPVHAICQVFWGKRSIFDIMALTDRRLILIGKGTFREESEDYALTQLNSISVNQKMMSTLVEFVAAGKTRSVKAYDQAAAKKLVNKARELMHRPADPVAPPAPSTPDPIAQLKELGALRDAGILTEDEFANKKAEILSRI